MTEPAVRLFLSGADMDPTSVLAAYPGARFLARAWVSAGPNEIAAPFASQFTSEGPPDVWGIVIEQAYRSGAAGASRQATTDDGRQVEAVLAGDQFASGAPEAVVAAARYWELPPGYAGRLRDAITAAEDE